MSDANTPDEIRAVPHGGAGAEKIHVDSLCLRDRVILHTAKSTYVLTVGKNSHCILSSTNPSAKVGQIILRGGTNADVTEYTPNRIFVGGRLAYAFDEDASELVTTSAIESLFYEPGLR